MEPIVSNSHPTTFKQLVSIISNGRAINLCGENSPDKEQLIRSLLRAVETNSLDKSTSTHLIFSTENPLDTTKQDTCDFEVLVNDDFDCNRFFMRTEKVMMKNLHMDNLWEEVEKEKEAIINAEVRLTQLEVRIFASFLSLTYPEVASFTLEQSKYVDNHEGLNVLIRFYDANDDFICSLWIKADGLSFSMTSDFKREKAEKDHLDQLTKDVHSFLRSSCRLLQLDQFINKKIPVKDI